MADPAPRNCLALLFCLCCLCLTAAAEPPKAPAYGKGWDVYATSSGIALDGDVLYMTWPSKAGAVERALAAIDVTKPESPKLLSRLPLAGFPQDVAVAKPYVYVVNGRELLVIDASKPADLKLVKSLGISDDPLRGPQGIDVKGNVAYLACRRNGVAAVDIRAPLSPKVIATADTPGFARDVTAAGDYLYVADDTRGMQVFDIRSPDALRPAASLAAPNGCIGRIRVLDGIAYLAGGNTLTACVSLEKVPSPRWLGSAADRHLLSPFFGSFCHDLAVGSAKCPKTGAQKLYAYAADGESGLVVVDVTDPAEPVFAGGLMEGVTIGGATIATSICIRGTYAYLNDESYGLRIVDLSSSADLRLVGEGLKLHP